MANGYKCVLLFGPPGSGKGTQGKKLGELDGFVHLATGDIFRSLDTSSELGQQFRHYSSRGELVPDELTMKIWLEHVQKLVAAGTYDPDGDILLLDGMPRTVPQAEHLDPLIDPLAIIRLVVSNEDEMVKRMKLRAEKEGRHDDADENVIRNRFDVYKRETRPVLDHYDPRIILEIDALGTIDEVFENVRQAIKPVYEANFAKA
jgi:adenylate kinase